MTLDDFQKRVAEVTAPIAGRPLDQALEAQLQAQFPPNGEWFSQLKQACQQAIAEGWMCNQEAGGIRYGRVLKATEATHQFSVDVVLMNAVKGPYHRHPNGEIDLVIPLSGEAKFDGRGAGWCVYGPESAHYPTVTGGEAIVLYLLPGGAIDFKARPPA